MILLSVLSYNSAPTDVAAVSFDELGGSIGRADNNLLVLPDPERTISRVHARVVFRSNGYYIVDNGSNPISVNGTPLGAGREHLLAAGDKVQIGGYLLEATLRTARAGGAGGQPGSLADLFGDVDDGLAAPADSPRTSASVMRTWASDPAQQAGGGGSSGGLAPGHIPDDWDPFGDAPPGPAPAGRMGSSPGHHGGSAGYGGSTGASAGLFAASGPSPFDLPASTAASVPAPAQAGRSAPVPGLGDFAPLGAESIDQLFGLSDAPIGVDPLGAGSAPALLMQPNTAAHDDPLQALARPARAAPASLGDLGSELNTPMPLQRLADRAAPAPAAVPRPPSAPDRPAPAATPVSLPAGAVFSWDAAEVSPVAPPAPRGAVPQQVGAPAARPLAGVVNAPQRPQPSSSSAAADRAGPAGDPALLAAFVEGLGAPGLGVDRLTPAMMLLLGQFMREATRGTIELLAARAALKREMRAKMTMIRPRENNPLKFSPTVEVALQHLLGPPTPGFMGAAPAVRDAFDDLRAHEMGVMSGMKAALTGVIERFDPAVLEGKITRKSAIGSLIPATRKARLWELYQELFGQISAEAEDDFDDLFGSAFLRAYEDELDSLARQRGQKDR